jgi:hypothetical protein
MSDTLYKSNPLVRSVRQSLWQAENLRFIGALIGSTVHNTFFSKIDSSDICIMANSNRVVDYDGIEVDRISGYFCHVYPLNTSMVFNQYTSNQLLSYDNAYFFTLHNASVSFKKRLVVKTKDYNLAKSLLNVAFKNAKDVLGFDFSRQDSDFLLRSFAELIAISQEQFYYYVKWFEKRNIKLLIKEDASYGGMSAIIVAAAHKAGVVTAECQHGAITSGHDAYNVAPTLLNSPLYANSMPTYFLSYGSWWNEQINTPSKKIVIGGPHRSNMLGKLSNNIQYKNNILILGDGIETSMYLELVRGILPIAKKLSLKVVFRAHPLERKKVNKNNIPNGCYLDDSKNIYEAFCASHVVISELSTGLFEAIGLCDRIIVWKTDKAIFSMPTIPFMTFTSLSDLELLLSIGDKDSDSEMSQIQNSKIWDPDWKKNYRHFVQSII